MSENQCRLWVDGYVSTLKRFLRLFINGSIAGYDRVVTIGNPDALCLTIGIQHHDDMLPRVYALQIVEFKGHYTVGGFEKAKMFSHKRFL